MGKWAFAHSIAAGCRFIRSSRHLLMTC